MSVEDLLNSYNDYKAEIKTKQLLINKIELEDIKINGSNFEINGDIRPKGYMTSNVENKIINRQDEILVLKKEINELELKIEVIENLINTLSDYHREIADLKYKYNKNDNQIATIMKREERTIRYANKKILKILEEKYNNFLKIS